MSTSFKKRVSSKGRPSLPAGTKPSLANNQLLLSTGIPSLDAIIGGGLALGTVLLVEEDVHNTYGSMMHKYFLAEGAACNHCMFIASADKNLKDIVQELPEQVGASEEKDPPPMPAHGKLSDDELKIAWRYSNMPKNQPSTKAVQFGHYFDLSKTLSADHQNRLSIECFHAKYQSDLKNRTKINPLYQETLKQIEDTISKHNLSTSNTQGIPNILRISLQSLGSPFWNETLTASEDADFDPSLTWFLLSLRALLRSSYAACMVSIPAQLFQDKAILRRIHHCCDTVIALESFAGSEKATNPMYNEYHGLFHVRKLSRLNSINGPDIDTSDLAFKLRRKKFAIEKLHLPPDISETVSRSQGGITDKPSIQPGMPLCGSMGPKNDLLDF